MEDFSADVTQETTKGPIKIFFDDFDLFRDDFRKKVVFFKVSDCLKYDN